MLFIFYFLSFHQFVVLILRYFGLILLLNIECLTYLIHFIMTNVQFTRRKWSGLFHFGACIFVPQCDTYRRYLTNACSQVTSVVASIAHICKLRRFCLTYFGFHYLHFILVWRTQYAASTATFKFWAKFVSWIGILVGVCGRSSVGL